MSETVELSVVDALDALITARGDNETELKASLKEIGRRDLPQLLTGLVYRTGTVYIIDVLEHLVGINAHGVAAEMTAILHYCGHSPAYQVRCLRMCQQIKAIPFGSMLLIASIALNKGNQYSPELQIEALKAFRFGVICLLREQSLALRNSFLAEFETLSKDRKNLRRHVDQVISELKK